MKVIRRYKDTGVTKKVDYPRYDKKPIEGLDSNIEFFEIIEGEKPAVNVFENIIESGEFIYTEGDELNIYNVTYSTEIKPDDEIIKIMNDSLGVYLDSNYPVWKREKYRKEAEETQDYSKKTYITNFFDEINLCRNSRDLKEEQLINNRIIPFLDWGKTPD